MSEIDQELIETNQELPLTEQMPGLSPEEEQALEDEREAAWAARLAPFKAVKRRLSDIEEVVTTMAEGML